MNINKLLNLAIEKYQAGNLQKSESFCKEILKAQPDNLDALHILGLLNYQNRHYDSAIEYFQKILQIDPTNTFAYFNLANSFREKGNFDEAITYYLKALQHNPNFEDAYYNLGLTYKKKGQINEAIITYQKALQLNPNAIDVYNNLGLAFHEEKLLNDAEICFQKALKINPDHILSLNNLGLTLKEMGELNRAVACFKKAIRLNSHFSNAYYNLGVIFQEKKELDEAITYFQRAIELNPYFENAYYNLGIAFKEKRQLEKAIDSYQKVIELNPTNSDAYINLGLVLKDKGQFNEALSYFQKAVCLSPDDAEAHWNMSLDLLLLGNFREGWKEYEWRHKVKTFPQHDFSQPLWDGTDIPKQTILIHAEQGFGDTIQFVRYAPLIAQRGAKVILECHRELISLLQSVKGIHRVILRGEPLPPFDLHCPLLSLPLVFDTTHENIPSKVPYITVDSSLIQKWKNRLKCNDSQYKIGLAWAGRPNDMNDFNRSCSLMFFSPLTQLDITFYSLQKGEASEEVKNPPKGMKLIDYTEEINDFSDTAALIENLDLVISVDTAVAHLAGALGKPVWTLLPFVPDWRWMLNREDSPWYPTMRLFRQPSLGDWESVITKILNELQKKS
jgi:tetratricopeptide (TPR) repeat protein